MNAWPHAYVAAVQLCWGSRSRVHVRVPLSLLQALAQGLEEYVRAGGGLIIIGAVTGSEGVLAW